MKDKVQAFLKKNKRFIIVAVVVMLIAGAILIFINKRSEDINISEYSSVNTICELASLRSYYHNVAMYEKEPDGGDKFVNNVLFWPFGGYTKVGYKQFWLEYSGVIETGVDANQIKISGPNAQGVFEIYVPDARVLSVYADENTLTEPLSENGWFTTISGKEKTEAFSAAQTAMRKEAENDQVLLKKAKDNVKQLLEQYVINTGDQIGRKYSVKWKDTP